MTKSRKLLMSVAGFILSVLLFFGTDIVAEASGNNSYLDSLNGGISAILDHRVTDSSAILNETAQQLNLNLTSADKEEKKEEKKVYTLVMANVSNALSVRTEPNSDAEKVGKLYKDCGGTILEKGDGWTKIQSGNVIGWAKDQYLFFGEEAEEVASNVGITIAKVTADVLNVREEPGMDAKVCGQIPLNFEAEVVDDSEIRDDDGWVCINYEGKDCFVLEEYVDIEFKIDAGETMEEIEIREAEEREKSRYKQYGEYTVDEETLTLFAALIHCEARGESYEGQVAVGAVVMNRVRSAAYPNTIRGVIYASGQFTPAVNGTLDRVLEAGYIQESCFRAAAEALSGYSNVGDMTHFRRVNGREGLVIGNHVFY